MQCPRLLLLEKTLSSLQTVCCEDSIRGKKPFPVPGLEAPADRTELLKQRHYPVKTGAGRKLLIELEPLLARRMSQKVYDVQSLQSLYLRTDLTNAFKSVKRIVFGKSQLHSENLFCLIPILSLF